jgi:hypothetical protein
MKIQHISPRLVSSLSLLALLFLNNQCSFKSSKRPVVAPESLEGKDDQTTATVLLINPGEQIIADAKAAGLSVKGDVVVEIEGSVKSLRTLETDDADVEAILNQPIGVLKLSQEGSPVSSENETFDHQTMYLAKQEIGVGEWIARNPQNDGRGVVVGVMDDGIAPDLEGLKTTSTGERKIIALGKNASALDSVLVAYDEVVNTELFYKEIPVGESDKLFVAKIKELTTFNTKNFLDLNRNGTRDSFLVAVVNNGSSSKVCVDTNLSDKVDAGECFGTFAATGEFSYWDATKVRAAWAEFNLDTLTLSISAGEYADQTGDVDYDSHGEGVAAVMAGHGIGGLQGPAFDGLAPGARIVSYDLSETSTNGEGSLYNAATFLRGYEWLGQQGAEVVNTSYSFFFYSAETQSFFNKAITAIIGKYKFVMSFSAGNNGPGLGSFNRGLIYPDSTLAAGAFVSKNLDEYVHGVTGLPEEGRVVYYSSRGPSPDGGRTPTVISPLASLTNMTAGEGYQAFNGTSSASPALAGLATILLSSIKHAGLNVDHFAIAHAIRASGQRLTNIPYIDQGYGLPNIARAFDIYKKIVSNQQFAYVSNSVAGGSGIFVKLSQLQGGFEAPVSLSGKTSPSQSPSTMARLLIPTTIEANVEWLNLPRNGWVSTGSSRMHVSFSKSEILSAMDKSPNGELTGEIVVRSTESKEILTVVPVTVVDDRALTGPKVLNVKLGAEDGVRFHFGIAPNTEAIEVVADSMNFKSAIGFQIYDANAVRGTRASLVAGRKYLIQRPAKGWNQLAFVRNGGTEIEAHARVTISPVQISLLNKVVSAETPKVAVRNANAELNGLLVALPLRTIILDSVKISKLDAVESWALPVPELGTVWVAPVLNSYGNISYSTSNCNLWIHAADGSIVASVPTDGTAFDVTEQHRKDGVGMTLLCNAFELGAKPSAAIQVEWNVNIKFFAAREDSKPWTALASQAPVRIPTGNSMLDIPGTLGNGVELFYRVGIDGGEVALGVVTPVVK